ncbi:unnamed protein product [Dicrocoelium dendriticum]|nr:unnamed protein product [Dicrocoelium dendriticum]
MDDVKQSSQMRHPLSLCVLRPKPECTDAYSPTMSPNEKTVGVFPDSRVNGSLDSKTQCTSDASFKTEENLPMDSLYKRRISAIEEPAAYSVYGQEQLTHT